MIQLITAFYISSHNKKEDVSFVSKLTSRDSSSGRARTYNPSVNSRMLCHWATEEYRYRFVSSSVSLESGDDLLSRAVSSQVPSALRALTSVFGMGTGASLSLLSPEILFDFQGLPFGFLLRLLSLLLSLSRLLLLSLLLSVPFRLAVRGVSLSSASFASFAPWKLHRKSWPQSFSRFSFSS